MKMLAGLIILSTYVLGSAFTVSAYNDARQHIQITHSHPIVDHEPDHDDDHSHDYHHDHADADHAKPADHEAGSQSGEHDDQSVPHTHCISVSGAVAHCLGVQSVKISPVPATPVIPVASDYRIPDDPALASIFRPPIA